MQQPLQLCRGIFYRQFSITLAVAIVLSGVVALTLTPVLCAMLLKPQKADHERGPLGRDTGETMLDQRGVIALLRNGQQLPRLAQGAPDHHCVCLGERTDEARVRRIPGHIEFAFGHRRQRGGFP